MSSSAEDKEKIISALGGRKGIIDSTVPSVVFLGSYNITKNLEICMMISLVVATFLLILRLIRRDKLMHTVSGFIAVAFCGWLAWKTGKPSNYFQPSLWKNSAFLVVYLISIIVKWPVIGLMLGAILGENLAWRKDPLRLRAYTYATWIWFALFATRLAIQYPLYLADEFKALGVANIFLGFPLYALTLWGTWRVISAVPLAKNES
jgi:hypothetical protein